MSSNAPDALLIDRITALERLKAGCAAAQAKLTATFADSQIADATARHHRLDAARRSVAGQVALARRDSPFAGRRHVAVAAALVNDMPHALAALSRGDLSERRARIIVERLGCLTPLDRRTADRLLAPDMPSMGDRSAETRAAAMAYRLDPKAVMAKVHGAVKDRHVSLRPAPDTMSRLSALLPAAQGVGVLAALLKGAAAATAAPGGDPRNRGQLMADALVSAVTGRTITGYDAYGVPQYAASECDPVDVAGAESEARAASPDSDDITSDDITSADSAGSTAPDTEAAVPADGRSVGPRSTSTAVAIRAGTGCTGGCGLSISVIMTDRTLFDGDDEPALLTGYGPIPAPLARALVIGADTTTRTFVRRLHTDPVTRQLNAMDARVRLFPKAAQRFLLARDHTCRTPWCDAPIRQYDHVRAHADGGPTTTENGRGACQTCNLTKEAPHWSSTASGNTVVLTSPTGHTYGSVPPPPPRSRAWQSYSVVEHHIAQLLRGPASAWWRCGVTFRWPVDVAPPPPHVQRPKMDVQLHRQPDVALRLVVNPVADVESDRHHATGLQHPEDFVQHSADGVVCCVRASQFTRRASHVRQGRMTGCPSTSSTSSPRRAPVTD